MADQPMPWRRILVAAFTTAVLAGCAATEPTGDRPPTEDAEPLDPIDHRNDPYGEMQYDDARRDLEHDCTANGYNTCLGNPERDFGDMYP